MSPRAQAWVATGAVLAILLAIVLAGVLTRPTPAPVGPQLGRLDDAVALGMLDAEVLDGLRAGGRARAIVNLDTAAIIAGLEQVLGPDRSAELITAMSAAFATNKDAIRRALGPGADLIRDYAHLGAFVVEFRDEATLLAVLRSDLVRDVTADIPLPPIEASTRTPALDPAGLAPSEFQGAGVFVGVLDTGVDAASYPDFFPAGSVAGTFEAAPEDGALDDHGHGTHVASTVLLMAPQAGLYVADVFHVQERTPGSGQFANLASWTDVLSGMDWLIKQREVGVNLRAVNISLGSGHYPPSVCSDRYHLAEATAAGMIPVGAAGNSAFRDDEDRPTSIYQTGIGSTGCDPNVMSVGAVTNGSCADGLVDTVAEFSQSSETLDILAPGDCITAAGGVKSGTSMAAPHVAGAVAVLASARTATNAEIWSALVSTGPTITDPNSGIATHRLDIPAAVNALLTTTGPLPTAAIPVTRGVAVSTQRLAPSTPLAPGRQSSLDPLVIRNTGSAAATYRMVLSAPSLLAAPVALAAPLEWISVSPSSITLQPDDLGFVFVDLKVPAGAAPGDYAAVLAAVDDGASATEAGLPVLITFTVRPDGTGGGGDGGGGGSGTGDPGSAGGAGLFDDPAVLLGGGLLLLVVAVVLLRRGTARR